MQSAPSKFNMKWFFWSTESWDFWSCSLSFGHFLPNIAPQPLVPVQLSWWNTFIQLWWSDSQQKAFLTSPLLGYLITPGSPQSCASQSAGASLKGEKRDELAWETRDSIWHAVPLSICCSAWRQPGFFTAERPLYTRVLVPAAQGLGRIWIKKRGSHEHSYPCSDSTHISTQLQNQSTVARWLLAHQKSITQLQPTFHDLKRMVQIRPKGRFIRSYSLCTSTFV